MSTDDKTITRIKRLEKEWDDLVSALERIKKALESFKVKTTDLQFDYLNRSCEIRLSIKVPRGIRRKLGKYIEIPAHKGFTFKEIMDTSLPGILRVKPKKVDNKWLIPTDKLTASENYLIFIRGKISKGFLDSWVKLNIPTSSTYEDGCEKYWIHANLRNTDELVSYYQVFDVDNVTIGVDVGVQRFFSAAMPKIVRERHEKHSAFRTSVLSGERDKWIKKAGSYAESLRKPGGDLIKFANLAAELVSEDYFRDFLKVDRPFEIGKVERDPYSIILPEKVLVETNSQLTIEEPVAKGYLIFERDKYDHDVKRKVDEAFPKRKKPKGMKRKK